jgi:3-hydroxyisobutyrate dehydrogenase-like beta-hydroxyacid dehydrogenase
MNDTHQPSQGVSVIGLGSMGAGIARAFLKSGCRVSVWNRSREKVDALVSSGAIACDGPKDALDANTHVVVCVSTYSAWQKVIEEHDLTGHFNGTCIIQLTTGTIDDVEGHASLIKESGGRLADGAVLCYPSQLGTEDGSLLMSGAAEVLEECDPLLRILAATWTNLGEDIRQPAVLSRALISGMVTSLVGLINGVAICQAGGVSLDLFKQFFEGSNTIINNEQARLINVIRDGLTEETEASISAWGEGHQAVLSVAETLKTDLLLQDAVQAVFQEGHRMGLSDHDLSALVNVFAPGSE